MSDQKTDGGAKSHLKLVQELMRSIRESPDQQGLELRMSFANIILGKLRSGWTQKRLADAAGMKPSFVNRLVHAESNCTFDVVARVLHALGTHANLVEVSPAMAGMPTESTTGQTTSDEWFEMVCRIDQTEEQDYVEDPTEEITRVVSFGDRVGLTSAGLPARAAAHFDGRG